MQRRQFTQSLVAASTGLLLATSSRAVGVQDPMDAKSVTIGCSLGTSGALASLGKELKQGLDAGIAQAARGGGHGGGTSGGLTGLTLAPENLTRMTISPHFLP